MTSFGPLQQSEASDMSQIVGDSFNMPHDRCALWLEHSGIEEWRALKDDSLAILGGLLRIPMAQWFGGRQVSMTGLAGVAISTAGRGKQAGQQMMKETLQEMRAEGTALSTLYGSTTSFYRRCGYERAGTNFMVEIPLRELQARGGPLEVRPLGTDSYAEVEALQAQHVQAHGCLVRGPYLWLRTRTPRGVTAHGFGFYRDNVLEGYAYLVKDLLSFRDNSLEASDLVLTTPDAMATFLGLLASHRAFFTSARWPSPTASPLLLSMPEPWQYQLRLHEHWLLRIVSVEEALNQRGYPQHLTCDLSLQVEDPWFPDNRGPWTLSCAGGYSTLERGGAGDLRLDVGALAALYTGFMSAEDLALAGRVSGSADTLATATAIFGGWTPQLADLF